MIRDFGLPLFRDANFRGCEKQTVVLSRRKREFRMYVLYNYRDDLWLYERSIKQRCRFCVFARGCMSRQMAHFSSRTTLDLLHRARITRIRDCSVDVLLPRAFAVSANLRRWSPWTVANIFRFRFSTVSKHKENYIRDNNDNFLISKRN